MPPPAPQLNSSPSEHQLDKQEMTAALVELSGGDREDQELHQRKFFHNLLVKTTKNLDPNLCKNPVMWKNCWTFNDRRFKDSHPGNFIDWSFTPPTSLVSSNLQDEEIRATKCPGCHKKRVSVVHENHRHVKVTFSLQSNWICFANICNAGDELYTVWKVIG